MDYYSILGVNRDASDKELKSAYKKASMQHHPDRGGNEEKFKQINEAYSTLKDPQKRQQYDNPQPQGFGPGGFEGMNLNGFEDLFRNFGFNMGQRRPQNRQIDLALDVTMEDVYNGKQIAMEVQLPTGRTKLIDINVPAGVEEGQTVRYAGMGDNSVQNVPPGDLMVHIRVRNHPRFQRYGDNILCEEKILIWDLMLGTHAVVTTLSGKQIKLNVPAGTPPDTTLSCNGEGLPNIRTKKKGNLLVRIKALMPREYTDEQRKKIMEIKHGL
jgi:curved DNA-binding protein